jgi:tetratricopeptide (TPR) repeat protein
LSATELEHREDPLRPNRILISTTIILLAVLAGSCSGGSGKVLEVARLDYEAGHYVQAWESFQENVPSSTNDAGLLAARGHAAMAINLYEEAIPFLRRAVELAPADPIYWEWYLGALAWGGLMSGQRELLEEVLERGVEGLQVGEDRPGIYDLLLTAAESLQALTRYSELVERTRLERPESPVPDIKRWEFLLQSAAAIGDSAGLAAARGELAMQTAAWRMNAGAPATMEDTELYRLALAHLMTGRRAEALPLLEELERRPSARRFSRPLRYDYLVLPDYVALYRVGDIAGILEQIPEWLSLLPAIWESDLDYRRVLLEWQVDALLRESPPSEEIDEERLETLLQAATELFRRDTWGTVEQYGRMAGFMVEHELRPEQTLEILDEALARLDEDRPGMLVPGQDEMTARQTKETYRASLLDLQARTLERLDRQAEAAAARDTIEQITVRVAGESEDPEAALRPAPDFRLRDTTGRDWRLEDLAGRAVVLAFWAPWNGESLRLVQDLDRFAQARRQDEVDDDTVYLVISLGPGDRPTDLLSGLRLPRVDDPGDLALRYRITGIPTTLLIDGAGRIRWHQSGYPGPQAFEERLALRIDILKR